MLDLNSISLLEVLKKYDNKMMKCINEADLKGSQNYKALVFWTNYELEIGVFINVNQNDIEIEVLFENICKNIDKSDEIMDKLIDELRIRIHAIKKYLENKYSRLVKVDTVIGNTEKNFALII
ncbi:MAG: hypothetical protein AB9856_06875 [Cellulosilyticaceae bacterium]